MDTEENRVKRWVAYFLEDLDSADAEAVEAEMKAMPEEARDVQEMVEGIRQWSTESVTHVPLKLDELDLETSPMRVEMESAAGSGSHRSSIWIGPGMLVAASILLLALTQIQFSVSFGDSTFSWGMDAITEVSKNAAGTEAVFTASSLVSRIDVLEEAAADLGDVVEALAHQDSLMAESFKQNALELAHFQRVESQTRLRDMKRMMSWTDYPDSYDATFASDAGTRGTFHIEQD